MKSYVIFFVLVLSASTPIAQTGPTQATSSDNNSSADFLGTVVEATGKPLDGVRVTLTNREVGYRSTEPDPTAAYSSVSNENGLFSITEIPPGEYALALEKDGYLRVPSEKNGPATGERVRLKRGDRFTNVVLRMARSAIITGRLLGESGKPLARAMVSAKSADSIEENWQTANTNDRGEFRLAVLPGKYLVFADASSHVALPPNLPTGIRLPNTRSDYQITYFPGVATRNEASLVEAVPGGVTNDIDFTTIKVLTYTVSVEVTGIPKGSGDVSIHFASSNSSDDGPAWGAMSTKVDLKDGNAKHFLLGPWPTGTYRLFANYEDNEHKLQSTPVDVTVVASDVQGVELALASELELDGAIQVTGGSGQPEQMKRTVWLMPPDRQSFSLMRETESRPDGTFEIVGIAHNKFLVMVEPLPKNGFIQSIELNGVPVSDRQPDLLGISGVAHLKVVICLNGAHISGKLDQKGEGGRTKVVLLTRGAEPNPENFHMTTPGADGSYSFEGIAPGNYVLMAFRLSEDVRKMPELIQQNKQAAVMIEIKEGDIIAKDLKVITEDANSPPE